MRIARCGFYIRLRATRYFWNSFAVVHFSTNLDFSCFLLPTALGVRFRPNIVLYAFALCCVRTIVSIVVLKSGGLRQGVPASILVCATRLVQMFGSQRLNEDPPTAKCISKRMRPDHLNKSTVSGVASKCLKVFQNFSVYRIASKPFPAV